MTEHQLGLLDPAKPLARRTDPETSVDGALHILPIRARVKREALLMVRQYQGMTASELSKLAGSNDPRIFNRRLGEMAKGAHPKIRRGDTRKCGRSGRPAATWWPT